MKNLLTKREAEIIELYVECSLTAGQVAYNLDIALNTVNQHLKSIRRKINAVSLVDMTNKYWKANYWLIRKQPTTPTPVEKLAKVVKMPFIKDVQYLKAA